MGRNDNLIIEEARIIFRNFAGKETQYNREGDRNFSVIIEDPDMAAALIEDGWNLKLPKPRDEDDEPTYHLKVVVKMDGEWPAKLFLVNRRGRPNQLDEDTVGQLDRIELDKVDLTINASKCEVNGKSGIKAYLRDLYASQVEDTLARKYAHDDSPMEAFRYIR